MSENVNKPSVGTQAGTSGETSAYEWWKVKDPSERQSCLRRTPPSSKGVAVADRGMEEDPGLVTLFNFMGSDTPVNKVKGDNSTRLQKEREVVMEVTMESEAVEIKDMVRKLSELSKVVASRIRDTPNTKTEIKKAFGKLRRHIEEMESKRMEWEDTSRFVKKAEIGVQVELDKEEINKGITQEAGIEALIEIKACQTGDTGYPALAGTMDKEWPEEVFEATVEEKGDMALWKREGDIAIVVDLQKKTRSGALKSMVDRYPDVAELLDENMEEGKVEFHCSKMKTISSRGKVEQTSKYIYLAPYKADKEGMHDLERLYGTMIKIREAIKEHRRNNTYLVGPEGIKWDHVRKITESVFRQSGITVRLGRRGDPRPSGVEPKVRKGDPKTQKSRQDTEIVTVKAEGRSYAELLKIIKKEVDINNIGVSIKDIRKIRGNEVLLVVNGDSKMAGSLREEIKAKVGEADVLMRSNLVEFFITGMDETTTEPDVEMAIQAEAGKNVHIEVKALWTGRQGRQIARVAMHKEAAWEILKRGRVKVGWLMCKAWERMEIPRCYRCLGHGHIARDCKGEDRSGACLKCGKDGHRAKDCKNEEYCVACQKGGHRADKTRCPKYRKLLDDMGRRRRTYEGAKRRDGIKNDT